MVWSVAVFALLAAAPEERDPCISVLEQQAARDLHCEAGDVVAFQPQGSKEGEVEVGGCGLRASYRGRIAAPLTPNDPACVWEQIHVPTVDPYQAKNVLRFSAGFGAPTGFAGLSYERRIGSLMIEPGFGWGMSGFQGAFMLHIRNVPLLGSPGFGLSLGFGPQPSWLIGAKKNVILWFDVDLLAQEWRFLSGVALYLGIGVVAPFAGEFSICNSTCGPVQKQGFLYPTIRVGVGEWF
ncbi:MAG: hypothetical protein QM723_11165 [Myxococcaceae bacterium]